MDFAVYALKFLGFANRRASTFTLILQIILKFLRFYVSGHNRLEAVMEKL